MKRILVGLLLWAIMAGCAQAQSPIASFPPGVFSRAAQVGSSPTPFSQSFVTKAVQGTPGGSSCNFGTVSIGTADLTRQLVLVVGARFTTAATLSSITVGGVTQSVVVDTLSASAADLAITATLTTSGTTANITANYSTTVVRCEVAVYSVLGTTTVVSSAGTGVTGTGDNPSKTFTGTTGGGMIAGAITGTAADNTTTAANMTADVNETVAGAATTLFEAGSNTSHAGTSTAYSWQFKVANVNAGAVAFSAASWVSIAP